VAVGQGALEGVVSTFWQGRRVLVTGHTGFKGGWLSLWLQRLGAEVTGFALEPPTKPSFFEIAGLGRLVDSHFGDVRDLSRLRAVVGSAQPCVVFHLAAQPLVLGGYSDPVGTYDTNVMGTVNLLQALRDTSHVRAVINVTTDKVYENKDDGVAFSESDPLGSVEPYGSSKACSELVTRAMGRAFFDPQRYAEHGVVIATARAGNVIGGGDWGANRLLPDMIRSFAAGEPVLIRRPEATRPWQHVLDPLHGYVLLAERLLQDGPQFGGGWNFGPEVAGSMPVSWVVERCVQHWGDSARWERDAAAYPAEAGLLQLDCSQAREKLGWQPRHSLETALALTIRWYKDVLLGQADALKLSSDQIEDYCRLVTNR